MGKERVALTMDDLQSPAGSALCDEYGIEHENNSAVVIHMNHEQARHYDLADRYWRRLNAQPAETTGRVLVVDDEEPIRSLMVRLLARRGLNPDTAVDGEHALEKIRSGNYALILLDLMMPRRDGFDVLATLRASIASCLSS